MDDQVPDVLESAGEYTLAEVGQEYVVFDKSRPDQPLGRLAGDEDGLLEAEGLYKSLTAPFRRQRLVRGFLILFFTSLVVHVLGVAVVYLPQASQSSFGSTSSVIEVAQRWASAASTIANAVWIAALAGMAGIWLAQRVFSKEERQS